MESDVSVSCRKEDESLVKDVIAPAAAAYKEKMKTAVNLTMDSEYLPPAPSKVAAGAPSWYFS